MRAKKILELDDQLLASVRAVAATTGQTDNEIVEAALRQYLEGQTSESARKRLSDLLDEFRKRDASDLADDDSLKMAYAELHAMRRERRQLSGWLTKEPVSIELTTAQALVLDAMFARASERDEWESLKIEDKAEWYGLQAIAGALERALVETFSPDYAAYLERARHEVRGEEPGEEEKP